MNEMRTGMPQVRLRHAGHRWSRAVALLLVLIVAVAGCGSDETPSGEQADPAAAVSEDDQAEAGEGEGPADDAAETADSDPAEEGSGSSSGSEASGTLSFDGGDIALDRLECLQVPAEGNAWRIVATFDGGAGWVQFDAPSYGFIEFSNGDEAWSTEADAPLSVSSDGASGDVTMLLDGTASEPERPEARLVVDITC